MKSPEISSSYDPHLPASLKKLQHWFGSIIERSIDLESRIQPLTPSGVPIQEEAPHYILPGPKLQPHQRIEIYNQQYWWRLLNILQSDFPSLLHLYGYVRFNEEIATPYLERFPPNDWSLDVLGKDLANWIAAYFYDETAPLALAAAQVDYAFVHAFTAAHHSAIQLDALQTEEAIDRFLSSSHTLQPHITLLHYTFDLISFRDSILEKEIEHYLGKSLPSISPSPCFLIIYRCDDFSISMEEISETEFYLLKSIQKGNTIESACESLDLHYLVSLQNWFVKWLKNGYLYRTQKKINEELKCPLLKM